MVRDYNVVSKGIYTHKQTSDILRIDRFLIVRKKKRRLLLLDMENCSAETLTALKLQIEQYDVRGNELGAVTAEFKKVAYKQGKFILKKQIELHQACIDFRVKILYAEYGNYVYRLGDAGTYITYEKKKKRKKLDNATVLKKTGKEGRVSAPRRFKAPVFVGVFTAFVLVAAVALATAQLQFFKKDRNHFFLQNLQYQFVDEGGEDIADSPVIITGYIGLGGEDILIPSSIEGHPVTGVAEYAFTGNSIIKNLTVEKDVVVSIGAFSGCDSLESVKLMGNNIVYSDAFSECDSLATVYAKDVAGIGEHAFTNVPALTSLRIESSGADSPALTMGTNVFTGALSMSEIYIGQYIEYRSECNFFNGIGEVENLYLKNLNYEPYALDETLDKTLSDIFGESGTKIKNLTIEYADVIPAKFTEKCNADLESVTVRYLTEPTIGTRAFTDCEKLTALTLPKLVTGVGAHAFENTSITSFNALALKSLGEAAFKNCKALTSFEVDVLSELTSIPNEAFSGCESLELMFIPRKVSSIGENAFNACEKLSTLTFAAEGVLSSIESGAFEDCKSLETVALPAMLERIGAQAFASCKKLHFISIPTTVSFISGNAFAYCYKLFEIENLSSVSIIAGTGLGEYSLIVYTSASDPRMPKKTIGDYAFGYVQDTWYLLEYLGKGGEIVLPTGISDAAYNLHSYFLIETDHVTSVEIPADAASVGKKLFHDSAVKTVRFIGSGALGFTNETFSGCQNITDLDFGERAFEGVYEGMFAGCSSLAAIKLPSAVQTIGASAFGACTALEKVTGAKGLTTIGESAFNGCMKLHTFECSAALQTIENYAFKGCVALKNFKGAGALTSLGAEAFANCSALTEAELGNSLSVMGERAFENCTSLMGVRLPATLTEVQPYTFSGCTAMTKVTGGEGLLSVGAAAFEDCTSLNSASLGDSLTSLGERAFYNTQKLGVFHIPAALQSIPTHAFYQSGVQSLTGGDGLLAIHAEAFYHTSRLARVHLPENLTTVGERAFYQSGVQRVTGGARLTDMGAQAFAACESLQSVDLLPSITVIPTQAFYGCTALERIEPIETLVEIGESAFRECSSIGDLHLPEKLETIGNYAFYQSGVKSLTGGAALRTIGYFAFAECASLRSIALEPSLTVLTNQAFKNCTALERIEPIEGLEKIDSEVFAGCSSLGEVFFPDSLREIESYAFYQSGVQSITGGSGLSYIGQSAFESCTNLHTIALNDGITSFDSCVFRNCTALTTIKPIATLQSIGYEVFAGCTSLGEVELPALLVTVGQNAFYQSGVRSLTGGEGLQEIGYQAFYNCTSLRAVSLGDALVTIQYQAFYGCTELESFRFNENLSSIYEGAFYNCTSLRELYVPAGLSYIGGEAFRGCASLQSITGGENLLTIGYSAFQGCNALTAFTIPDSLNTIESAAFYECAELLKIDGGASLQTVGSQAFYNCDNLQTVAFDCGGACSIEYEAFYGCNALRNLTLTGVQTVGSRAFYDCDKLSSVTLADGLSSIESESFADCDGLTSVSVGNRLYSIGYQAFYSCDNLREVDFSVANNLYYVYAYAFQDCAALKQIDFPSSLYQIDEYAFQGTSLEVVDLSENLREIRTRAFAGLSTLKKIYVRNNMMYNVYGDAFADCKNLHDVYDLGGLGLTRDSTEYGYLAYNALVIHTSESDMALRTSKRGDFVLKDANGFWAIVDYEGSATELTLAEIGSITSYEIARYAFEEYTALKKLTIGSAVSYVHSEAFTGVNNLEFIDFETPSFGSLTQNAFTGCGKLKTIIIPTDLEGINYSFSGMPWNAKVYYEGDAAQWSEKGHLYQFNYYPSIYCYDPCIHNSNEWNYTAGGEINTEIKDYLDKVITKPTCTKDGVREYYCTTCSDGYTETIYSSGHSYNEHNVCEECGYISNMSVNANTLTEFEKVVNISNGEHPPFDLFKTNRNEIRVGGDRGETTALVFTAKEAVSVSFYISVSDSELCSLTVETDGANLSPSYDSTYYSIALEKGQTIRFVFTDLREPILEEPEISEGETDETVGGTDGTEGEEPQPKPEEIPEEEPPFAWIYAMYVSSTYETV